MFKEMVLRNAQENIAITHIYTYMYVYMYIRGETKMNAMENWSDQTHTSTVTKPTRKHEPASRATNNTIQQEFKTTSEFMSRPSGWAQQITHTYIYICMYIHVCMCTFPNSRNKLSCKHWGMKHTHESTNLTLSRVISCSSKQSQILLIKGHMEKHAVGQEQGQQVTVTP